MSARDVHEGTILIADDNELNRELLSTLLSEEGYQVILAPDGQQALEQVGADSIDLAILDVVMPRKTGFDVCLAIKAKSDTRLIPVLLVTGLNRDDDRIRGIMCGADDFLTKPVNKHELLARVHSLIRLKQFTDELDNAEAQIFGFHSRKIGLARRAARSPSPRRPGSRHWQAGCPGAYPPETWPADS